MHLEEGEERLQDRVRHQEVVHAGGLHRGVHSDLQAGEDQGAKAEHCGKKHQGKT